MPARRRWRAMAPLGPADRALRGRVRGALLRGSRGGGDQRAVADHGRGRGAAVTEFGWEVRDGVGFVTLDRRGAQEPADVRVLRRAARPLPRAGLRRRGQGRGDRGRGGELLLRRRRARHHRPADRDGHDRAAALHAHDRRPREGDQGLPAAGDRRDRRRLRGRGRDDRHRLRPAARHAAREGGVPLHARGAVGRGHGRVRDAAADRRPGPRRRAALHGPLDGRGRGRALGVLQSGRGCRRGGGGGARGAARVRARRSRTR